MIAIAAVWAGALVVSTAIVCFTVLRFNKNYGGR